MTSNPKAPEAMEWQQDEGDQLSQIVTKQGRFHMTNNY